jgi:hypothetical protein
MRDTFTFHTDPEDGRHRDRQDDWREAALERAIRKAEREGWKLIDAQYEAGVAQVERRRADGLREKALVRA